jgi:putative membrane protein
MRKVPFILAAAAFGISTVALPAAAQSIGEKTGVNAVTGTAPSTQDFVKEAAVSDMFEIEASKLAQQKGSPEIRAFASHMIEDHSKTTSAIKNMVKSGDVKAELPTALDASHQAKLDKLKSLSGEDFNKNYDESQRTAHKDAVSLFQRYANGGENPKLKEFASKTLPTLQDHQKMAQNLKP